MTKFWNQILKAKKLEEKEKTERQIAFKELRKENPMLVIDPKEGTVKLIAEGIEELDTQIQAAFNKAKKPKITRRSHKRPKYQNNRGQRVLREIADYQGTIYTEIEGMSKYDYRFWGPAEFLEELTDTSTYQEFKAQGIDFIITHNEQGYWMRRKLEQFETSLRDPREFIKKEKL